MHFLWVKRIYFSLLYVLCNMNEIPYLTVLKKITTTSHQIMSKLIKYLPWESERSKSFYTPTISWCRHQMETFSALLAFVRGIHRRPVNFPHKGQWGGSLMFSLICALNKRLSKQSWGWWFEMPSHSLWRHCNDDNGWQAFQNCKWPVWYVIWMFCQQTLTLLLVFVIIKVINPFSSWNVFLAVTKQL